MKEIKPELETFARIKVVGVGGSGNHAISRMIEANLKGIDFIGINTDAQDLHHCKSSEKIHIGKNLTKGLGAGMNPDVGRQAAEENKDEIQEALKNTDMVFITCGLGGGTGTGAAPIVAEAAREAGALTVAVVTKPFSFEGQQRKRLAEDGLEVLRSQVDTIITIPNDRLLQVIEKKTLLLDSFKIVDDILRQGVQGISDLITIPGIVNVDFADVKTIMQNTGPSLMGIGKATGENRAAEAAKQAINSPLLELSINGAKGVLFNITGASDLAMAEISEAANIITESIDPEAKVIFGAVIDENMKKGEIKITVIATGFENDFGKSEDRKKIAERMERERFERERVERMERMERMMRANPVEKEAVVSEKKEEVRIVENKAPEVQVRVEEKPEIRNEIKQEVKQEVRQKGNPFSSKINPVNNYDDEYDIPAFIRKKMHKIEDDEE